MIRDVSEAKFKKNEPRGANPKVWLELEYKDRIRSGLFKPTYVRPDGTNTQTHYGEAIYSDICQKLLHFPCADIEIATRNGEIGCVSYNVLENIPNNNEDYTRYNLIDMVSIIQRIRESFDASGLKIKGTQEYYSLDLLMEAIDNYISDKDQNRDYKDYLLYMCLIDSATNYFDRHALNLAAAEERTTGDVIPPETFDNGTCLSLGIRQNELEEYLNQEDGMQALREKAHSKIGIHTEAPISFERLETQMFNNYFDEVAPFFEELQRDLTLEGVEEILESPAYEELDSIYKNAVIKQIEYNKQSMRERFEKSKKRNEIEKLFLEENDINILNQKIGNYFKNAEFSIGENILDEFSLQSIQNIEHIPDEFESGAVTLSHKDKNLALWTVLIANMIKRMDPELPTEAKKILLREFFIKEFNFCKKDLDQIQKLVDVYEYRLDEESAVSVHKFIFGSKQKEGLGSENVTPFIALKLAEYDVSERHKERYDKFIELYGEVLRKEEFITEHIQYDYQKSDVFKRIGVTDSEEITFVLYHAIDKINESGKRFSSTQEFYDFLRNAAKEVLKETKTEVKGVLVDNDVKEFLEQCTYELENGKKITIISETLKNADFISYVLGSSYFVSIGDAQNGKGRNLMIAARDGEEMPTEVIEYAEKMKQIIQEKRGGEPTKGDIVLSGIYKKPKEKSRAALKSGALISIATGREPCFAFEQTPEELRKNVLSLFRTKERNCP